MTEQKLPQNLQEAQEYAAHYGVSLTPGDYRKIGEIQAAAQANEGVDHTQKGLQRLVAGFNRHYPNFLKFLTGVAEVMITTSQTAIVAFGAPIVLILLLIVEHSRVKLGIGLFESEAALASFAAWSMVILNTVLEFTIYHIEHKNGYVAERELRGSLRLYGRKISYWLGIGTNWRPVALSPANRYKKLQRLVTFAILALATAGSMREVIANQAGRWHEALLAILTDSSLSQMSTWLGGLLFAVAAVLSAQVVTAYLAIRSREIIDGMSQNNHKISASDQAAIQYIMAKVANKTGVEHLTEYVTPVVAAPVMTESEYHATEGSADFLAVPAAALAAPNGNGKNPSNGKNHKPRLN